VEGVESGVEGLESRGGGWRAETALESQPHWLARGTATTTAPDDLFCHYIRKTSRLILFFCCEWCPCIP